MADDKKNPESKPLDEIIIKESGTVDNDDLLMRLQSNDPPSDSN